MAVDRQLVVMRERVKSIETQRAMCEMRAVLMTKFDKRKDTRTMVDICMYFITTLLVTVIS